MKNYKEIKWSRLGTGKKAQLCRFEGHNFPCIGFMEMGGICARDNNGHNPSPEIITRDMDEKAFNAVLAGLSKPHPTVEDMSWFLGQSEGIAPLSGIDTLINVKDELLAAQYKMGDILDLLQGLKKDYDGDASEYIERAIDEIAEAVMDIQKRVD